MRTTNRRGAHAHMKNEITQKDGIIAIVISTRAGNRIALIDAEDFDKIDVDDRYGLFKDRHGKPSVRSGKESGQVFLHKKLADIPRGSTLVHKNGDELDYRKANLQLVDKAGNITELAPAKEQTQVDMAIEVLGEDGLEEQLRGSVNKHSRPAKPGYSDQPQPLTAADKATDVILDAIYDKQEGRKTSDVKGVYYHKHKKKWHASAFHQGKRYSLCYFDDVKDAENEVQLFRLHGPESALLKRNKPKETKT